MEDKPNNTTYVVLGKFNTDCTHVWSLSLQMPRWTWKANTFALFVYRKVCIESVVNIVGVHHEWIIVNAYWRPHGDKRVTRDRWETTNAWRLKSPPLIYMSKGKESPKNASPLGKSHNVFCTVPSSIRRTRSLERGRWMTNRDNHGPFVCPFWDRFICY